MLIDCLTPELYQGHADRHLWGQRRGQIPGAVNVPYLAILILASSEQRPWVAVSGRLVLREYTEQDAQEDEKKVTKFKKK